MSGTPKKWVPDWRENERAVLAAHERFKARWESGGDIIAAQKAEQTELVRAHHQWVVSEEGRARIAFIEERLAKLPKNERPAADDIEGRLLAAVTKIPLPSPDVRAGPEQRAVVRPPADDPHHIYTAGHRDPDGKWIVLSSKGVTPLPAPADLAQAAKVDARVTAGDVVVRDALADLWREVERQAKAVGRWPHMEDVEQGIDQAIANQPGPFYEAATGAAPRTRTALGYCQSEWLHPGLEHRVVLALLWPGVLAEWRKTNRAESLARVPTPLVIGEGAIAPLFGRSLPPGTNVAPRRGIDGRLRNVVITRRASQLDLLVPDRLEIDTATNEQVLDTLARVLSNREWRFLVAVLVAMHDDYATGRAEVPGGFFYTPSRFGELLGLKDREAKRDLDLSLEILKGVSLTATMKRGGKDFRITAEALLVDGRGTLAALGKRGRGRPSARLYRFQDFILGMLKGDGSWFPVTKDMLRPPSGVDPRTYDDAFKLETVLAAYARTEVKKAKKPGLVWRRKADTLIEASGITWQGARPHVKRERLRELLEVLNSTGRVVGTYDQATHAVSYDLPAVRPAWVSLVDGKSLKTLKPS